MRIMSWIRAHLPHRCEPTVSRADAAIDMADEVAKKAKSLQKQLEPFSHHNDPFHAAFTRHAMSVEHERRVEFEETARAKWKDH